MTDAKGRVERIRVRVFANEVDGDVVFTHEWSANGGAFEDPPIQLPRGRPDWNLTYRLYDRTGRNLQFPAAAADAMWVKKTSKKECPTGKSNGSGHVSFGNVSSSGPHGHRDQLVVSDDNRGAACILRYMLRFDPEPDEYKYDPVITNGGTN